MECGGHVCEDQAKPGTPPGPAILWLCARRSASCMIAGEMYPLVMWVELGCVGAVRDIHGNRASGGRLGSG